MKKVLITGANSYIGDSFRDTLLQDPDEYSVMVRDTIGWDPKKEDLAGYDAVFHVAGIAHIRETAENRHLYFDVNRDLAIRTAEAAKDAGVRQFILLSTMSVYGLTTGHVAKDTPVHPVNAYGQSKAEADARIAELEDGGFRFACLRPPMVYGKGCKGNYQSLRAFALKVPFFPDCPNRRSMIHIDNLCGFVRGIIDREESGLFFPQNAEYVSTAEMVRLIAECHGRKIRFTKLFNPLLMWIPVGTVKNVFGSLTYEKTDPVSIIGFEESIRKTEGGSEKA